LSLISTGTDPIISLIGRSENRKPVVGELVVVNSHTRGSLLVVSIGVVLFAVATLHHATEVTALESSLGPLLAFLIDGIPALGIIYGGFYLASTDFEVADQWVVGLWCVAGAMLFAGTMSATVLVRAFENRAISEPLFSLLVSAEAGAIAGFVAGFYNARARADARRAQRVTGGLRVVNSAIRHDLRNDLNTIQIYAELVERDTDETEYPTVIRRKTEEAAERIDDLDALGKAVTGDASLETVDIVSLVEEIVASTEETYDHAIETDMPESVEVIANQALRSVVDNLLENAVEHTDANPQIEVAVESTDETVRLSVSDDGPGISEDATQTIFDYRPDSTGGGGLFLVKTLVSEYGGDVWVEDSSSGGATFVVELQRFEEGSLSAELRRVKQR
jgi:signal transduction histidine kinase